MPTLKEREERLRFLLTKVDSEIDKFESLLGSAENLQSELDAEIRGTGLQSLPINFTPHTEGQRDLQDELKQHILSLNKLKNLINKKLKKVIREEELLEGLQKKYGDKVSLKGAGKGELELIYKDEETEKMFSRLKNSKKMISQLKESVNSLADKEE